MSRANTINDRGGYFLNGVFTQLTSATGSVQNLAVHAEDIFGFSAQASPQSLAQGIQSRTVLTISDFNVSAVPNPPQRASVFSPSPPASPAAHGNRSPKRQVQSSSSTALVQR